MSTFLQLCQDVTRESGTLPGVVPSAVTSQSDRLLKVVNWTAEAWRRIQLYRRDWLFLRTTFSGPTVIGQSTYTAANLNITDFGAWVLDDPVTGYRPFTHYETAVGVSDEQYLTIVDWEVWRTTYDRGTQTNNRPNVYAVTPARDIALGPLPDKIYTVRGEYMKVPEVLAANDTVPALPVQFHQIIVWRALILLEEDGEDVLSIATAQRNYIELLGDLERDQLPTPARGGSPIA